MKTKLLICMLFFAVFSCTNSTEKEILDNSIVKIANVKTVNPEIRNFTSELEIIGNALPNKQVNIHAMEGGFLSKLKKDLGDKAQKGEVLAKLNNPELSRQLLIDRVAFQTAKSQLLTLIFKFFAPAARYLFALSK